MRIALFHNAYRTRGGEDAMVELEAAALEVAGHAVSTLRLENKDLGPLGMARAAWDASWSGSGYEASVAHLLRARAQVGHVHNWFPRFSPAVYAAHQDLGIPVFQTLHNYRLGCAAGTNLRAGSACHDCTPGDTRPALRHGCYRGSRLQSLVWANTMGTHWDQGTFGKVDGYFAPSLTVARRHIQLGIPAERIWVVPNACADPWAAQGGPSAPKASGGALYVGRLSAEKGADVLLKAWRGSSLPLRLVGEGPEQGRLQELAAHAPGASLAGFQAPSQVSQSLADAGVVVLPHRWEEPFGLVVIEAFAAGRPVIASDLGGPAELINHGVEGLLVPAGDPEALARATRDLLCNPARLAAMGRAARATYEERFTPAAHARALLSVFRRRRLPEAGPPAGSPTSAAGRLGIA